MYRQDIYHSARARMCQEMNEVDDTISVDIGNNFEAPCIMYDANSLAQGVAILLDEDNGVFLWKPGIKQLIKELELALERIDEVPRAKTKATRVARPVSRKLNLK